MLMASTSNRVYSDLYKNVETAGTIIEIFRTGQRLRKILMPYLARYRAFPSITKPVNLIVITDSVPSDYVESSIVEVAEELDTLKAPAWQVGIQVGKDTGARDHLKCMDDGLVDKQGNRIRDIVNTVPFTSLGSVNRRLDRNPADLHRR